jgi:hypothetical protein
MKFTKNEILKETDNAISVKIDDKNLWFQKKRVLFSDNGEEFEITDTVIEESKKNYEDFKKTPEQKITISTSESIEDYNDKVYRFVINLEINDEEKREISQPCFVSKKFVADADISDNDIVLPLWLWNKIEEDVIKNCVAYSNTKYNTNFTTRDYKILNTVEVIK